jgi:hypothetical protein
VAEGKSDRHGLESHLPQALVFAAEHLSKGRRLLVHCAQGRDRSVAVAVAILVAFFTTKQQPKPSDDFSYLPGGGEEIEKEKADEAEGNGSEAHSAGPSSCEAAAAAAAAGSRGSKVSGGGAAGIAAEKLCAMPLAYTSHELWTERLEKFAKFAQLASDEEVRAAVAFTDCRQVKPTLERCLHWVVLSRPETSPSRRTLKKLARFFTG